MSALGASALAASALAASALVACSAPPAPQPALTGQANANPNPPSGPPPTLAWQPPTGFSVERMPALARSGELVLLSIADSDGGRGFPNERVELRDRRDHVVERIDVLAADDYERLVPDGTHPTPALEARIAAANQRLAQLHAEHAFAPLVAHAAKQAGPVPKSPIEGDGLAVSFDADHRLRVRQAGAPTSAPLATVDGTSWLAPSGKRCPQCPPCENPASLAAFYSAGGARTIAVHITYAGTDACWEPPDQWHVVSW